MIKVAFKIILFHFFYYFGFPKIKPLNLVISLTNSCNSRCQTCNIWKQENKQKLTLDELNKIFANIGQGPYEIILTGGEPFLRDEIVKICQSVVKHIKPKVIIIPTNGLLTEVIVDKVQQILEKCPKTKLVVNISLDEIGEANDKIRGIAGAFLKATETYQKLRAIKNKNFNLNIHTVISRFNVKKIPEIYQFVQEKFKPDSYITEIAEKRVELDTVDSEITPLAEEYSQAIDFLIPKIKEEKFHKLSKITQMFRIQYYQIVKKILKNNKRVIPCYAGIASVQITPNGQVWNCCIKGQALGDLRSVDYNFKKIWQSRKASQVRKEIKNTKCFCPLANASYTNMLMHSPTLTKVVKNLIFK